MRSRSSSRSASRRAVSCWRLDQLGEPLSKDQRAHRSTPRSSRTIRGRPHPRHRGARSAVRSPSSPSTRKHASACSAGTAQPALVEGGHPRVPRESDQPGRYYGATQGDEPSERPRVDSRMEQRESAPARTISTKDIEERWAEISFFDKPPLGENPVGRAAGYRILQVYSRDRGQRAAELKFDVGQGTADLAYRSDLPVTFTASPSRRVSLRIEDENGRPAIARLTMQGHRRSRLSRDVEATRPRSAVSAAGLSLRRRGRSYSPDGSYRITWSGGPDYLTGTREIAIGERQRDEHRDSVGALDRSGRRAAGIPGDHHVHAAGCSHYQDPDARRRTRRHRAADSRRGAQRRQHPHLGPLLLPPAPVLLGQGRQAIHGSHEASL